MPKLNLILGSRKVLEKDLKCTLQKSLKLGFSADTTKELNLREGMGVLLYHNGEPATENLVYMQLVDEVTEDAYKIKRGGNYYSAATKPFFKKIGKDLGIDFTKTKYIYDMEKIDNEGVEFYQLTGRLPKGRSEEDEVDEAENDIDAQ